MLFLSYNVSWSVRTKILKFPTWRINKMADFRPPIPCVPLQTKHWPGRDGEPSEGRLWSRRGVRHLLHRGWRDTAQPGASLPGSGGRWGQNPPQQAQQRPRPPGDGGLGPLLWYWQSPGSWLSPREPVEYRQSLGRIFLFHCLIPKVLVISNLRGSTLCSSVIQKRKMIKIFMQFCWVDVFIFFCAGALIGATWYLGTYNTCTR